MGKTLVAGPLKKDFLLRLPYWQLLNVYFMYNFDRGPQNQARTLRDY